MITFYSFGPYFGLPDASPFVIKAMLLLKFAGLPFEENRHGYTRAPKGKLPYYPISMTRVPLSRIRPSSAFISRKNTASILMQGSSRSRKPLPGRSKKCARSTFIGLLLRHAGATTKILPKARPNSLKRHPHWCGPWCKPWCAAGLIRKDLAATPRPSKNPCNCRCRCPLSPSWGQALFDGRKAVRRGCDSLRLYRFSPDPGLCLQGQVGDRKAPKSDRLPRPNSGAILQKLYRGWKNRRIGPNKKLFSLLTARCRRPYPHRRHGSCAGRLEFCVSTTHSD